jgi:hypothetical protein
VPVGNVEELLELDRRRCRRSRSHTTTASARPSSRSRRKHW